MFGICQIPAAPVRAIANDRSEMVTMLLAGESVEILDVNGKWLLIAAQHDSYQGWVDRNSIYELNENEAENYSNNKVGRISGPISCFNDQYGKCIHLPAGSVIYKDGNSHTIAPGRIVEFPEGSDKKLPILKADTSSIVKYAMKFKNAPYLWGGRTIMGIDCSGFTQLVYLMHGIEIPRDASQQVTVGQTINLINESKAADLAFFDNEEGEIIHVGVILDDNKIIHAHSEVRIDIIDHEGIFNKNTRQYSHKLRTVKRII